MNEDIERRLKRIYAALGEMSSGWSRDALRVTPTRSEKTVGMVLDFEGGTTDDDLSNRVHTLVHNIANLRDHLRKWARDKRKDESKVDEAFQRNEAIRVVADLSNNDKHGYPPRDGGHSSRSPRLGRITRALAMTSPGSSFMFSLRDGSAKTTGEPKLVIECEVFDGDGLRLGSLSEIVNRAIAAWEQLLREFGLLT